MSWNYRAVKETQGDETTYCVYEVYYNKAGQLGLWTAEPVHAQGETLEELRAALEMMLRDIGEHPVLDMEELCPHFPASRGGAR